MFACPQAKTTSVNSKETKAEILAEWALCSSPVYTDSVKEKTVKRIVEPMHKALSSRRIPYRGVLYVGLMIDEHGDPYVVEFNVEFGDPECQITIPLIATDLGMCYTLHRVDQIVNFEC